ncbi:hypothetical protein KKF91_04665 [Myxococcota bacterium]|nr:hypothetical protein [Myxococcota bacterium]MBU1429840.1 hypothetical protein [Myxococcota bacterium]MBU1897752.1 hypothetical protein [Myxococcota bacterium]
MHSLLPMMSLILMSCSGAPLPPALRAPESVAALHQAIQAHCQDQGEGCRDALQAAYCEAHGGAWRRFYNGCRDACQPPRHPTLSAPPICTMDTPMGCDCGEDQCWDGLRCVTPPPPPPLFKPPWVPLAPECEAGLRARDAETARYVEALRCAEAWVSDLWTRTRAAPKGLGQELILPCLADRRAQIKALVSLINWAPDRQGRAAALQIAALKVEGLTQEVAACLGR